MAGRAALQALRDSGRGSSELSLIAHAGYRDDDHYTPVTYLQRVLNAPHALSVEIGAASNGGAAALVSAAEHLTARPEARAALITAGSLSSRLHDDRLEDEAGIVVGDGAAAAVLTREPGYARLITTTHTSAPHLENLSRGTLTLQDFRLRRRMLLEDTGVAPYLTSLRECTHVSVLAALGEAELTPSDISHTLVIAMGAPVIDVLLTGPPLFLSRTKSSWAFGRHTGHAGACDILLALNHLLRTKQPAPGEHILLISFGMGFRWTIAVLQTTERPDAR
ncbi:3-oxoacyl-[acyl-carrier-protein] synthase III C-terminal domain-containing protein [Streptomyces sp. NPDC059443]